MPTLPTSLALTSIADGSLIVAADHRNNYTAIQTAVNSLITTLGAGAAGQFLTGNGTTVSYLQPPATELAYNEFTADVAVSATTAATANTVVTASAVTFDGATAVVIEFSAPRADTSATLSAQVLFELYDGATDLGTIGAFISPAAAAMAVSPRFSRRLTPSAAAHTYSVRAWVTPGTATVRASIGGAAVFMPGFIRISKV